MIIFITSCHLFRAGEFQLDLKICGILVISMALVDCRYKILIIIHQQYKGEAKMGYLVN